jgi:hypothetical protein
MKAFISLAAIVMMMVIAFMPFGAGKVENKFEDGDESFRFVSTSPLGGQAQRNISIPRNSEISSATMNIRGDYHIMDEGQEYQSLHWPQNPSMDIFNDGVSDWAFPGTMGMQTVFSANATESDLRWDTPGQTRSIDFTIPRSTIHSASVTVNNTDARKFSYTMNLGGTQAWSKESLSFGYSGTSFTRDTLSYVTTGDVNGDKRIEMVAGGANGKVYVAKIVNGKWINATVIDLQIQASQRDILQVALGMLDETPGLDIVAACADGNVYYLLNQGGAGLYSGANQLVSGSPGRMASVCVEDVDNDGNKDIVAGNLNGRFYVFLNLGEASFDAVSPESFKWVPGGNGQMNSVAVYDIDSDGNPDLIGANSNKNLYIAKGTGNSNFDNAKPVITTATRDMNSVYVEDVNGDTFKDLIAASNDGRAYICMNLGGPNYGYDPGTFDTQPGHIIKLTMESGTNSLRTATARDVNGDGMPDIVALGTSNSGQIHVAINDGGSYLEENLMRPFSAGQSSKSLAVDDIDSDGDLDIAVTNGMRMDVWLNNQGKFTEPITGPGFLGILQEYINNAPPEIDRYGNPMVPIHLQINNRFTGALHFSELKINYSYTALVDFTSKLSDHMNATAGAYSEGEMVRIPITYKIESAGVLDIGALRIDSEVGLVPIIDFPKENSTLYIKEVVYLTGRANKDIDGNILNYTWTDNINGRFLGFGSRIKYNPTTKGNMSIQLRVLDELHDKETTLTVRFHVTERPFAILNFQRVVMSTREPNIGEDVSMKVYIKNTGKVNTTRVAFQVYLDKVQGTPIAADVIQKVDVARTDYVEVFWDANTEYGNHKLIFTIIGCDQPYTKGKDYPLAIEVQEPIVNSIMPYILAVLGGGIALGTVGVMIKRRRDRIAIRREKLAKISPDQRAPAEHVAGQQAGAGQAAAMVTISPTSQSRTGQDIYAADRSAESAQRYAAAAEAVAIHTTRFTCPRCGKSTEEEGLLCLECSARDALDRAMLAIDEANEMALDVDNAQELVKKAKADFAARKFADVIEAATLAEDEARSTKYAFDEAISIHGAGAEKAGPTLGPSLFAGEDSKARPKPAQPSPKPIERPATPPASRPAATIPAPATAAAAAPAKPVIAPAAAPTPAKPIIAPAAAQPPAKPVIPAAAPSTTPKPAAAPSAGTAPPAGHNFTNCPKCSKPVQPRWRICPNCQTKLV